MQEDVNVNGPGGGRCFSHEKRQAGSAKDCENIQYDRLTMHENLVGVKKNWSTIACRSCCGKYGD
jgi:hypothetical protein